MSNSRQKRISTDPFGNPYMLVGLKDKKGTGYGKGYVEIAGQLYKIEVSPAQKEGVTDWVKITKMAKRQQQQRF